MFTNDDIRQIEARGSSAERVREQLECFRKGFPWMKIIAPATPGNGITVLGKDAEEAAVKYGETAAMSGKCKFVPASGAASRMFKDLFAGLEKLESGKDIGPDSPAARFVSEIENFAFYDEKLFGKPEDTPQSRMDILEKTLTGKGLGYGSKPKGVIVFHKYPDGEVRTAFGEHLVEAQEYMRNEDGTAKLVVTISPEHRELFEAARDAVLEKYENRYGVRYDIEFTVQDKATDTVAADTDNRPFRTADGSLLFRPAGHGALIYNLDRIAEEVVSIKNIDNVASEKYLPATARYKKVLLGKALELRDRIHAYLHELDAVTGEDFAVSAMLNPNIPGIAPTYDERFMTPECVALCDDIEEFLKNELCIVLPEARDMKSRVKALRKKLDRPVRVCGMVRNEGEPGGGPFIVEDRNGATSLQILESVQINMADEQARRSLAEATHFNPVDIVCCLHDYKGNKFDLPAFVDSEAGFISSKSYQGRELKALELPGLWNGAMSNWNTMFVEVPAETFNPVKTVLDLLRPAHRN